jgi:cold shock CspA family protein
MDANTSTTRFNGTLKKWNAERGFGFVAAEQGGQDLFLHVSAMPKDGWIPVIGEPLSFEVEIDKEGRKRAVRVRRPGVPVPAKFSDAERARHLARQPAQSAGSGSAFGTSLVVFLLVASLGWYAYDHYAERAVALRAPPQSVMAPGPTAAPQIRPPAFQCDGRKHCSQMSSCSEAKLFLKNCPGMEMDGDGDGVPCEQQLCTGLFGG